MPSLRIKIELNYQEQHSKRIKGHALGGRTASISNMCCTWESKVGKKTVNCSLWPKLEIDTWPRKNWNGVVADC